MAEAKSLCWRPWLEGIRALATFQLPEWTEPKAKSVKVLFRSPASIRAGVKEIRASSMLEME